MIRKRCGSKIYNLELNNYFRCVIEDKLKKYSQIALLQYATNSRILALFFTIENHKVKLEHKSVLEFFTTYNTKHFRCCLFIASMQQKIVSWYTNYLILQHLIILHKRNEDFFQAKKHHLSDTNYLDDTTKFLFEFVKRHRETS